MVEEEEDRCTITELPHPPTREEKFTIMSEQNIMLNGDEDEEFRVFVSLHAGSLQSSGIPQTYWRSLHHKITKQVGGLLTDVTQHKATHV